MIKPKKHWGQHFLHDDTVIERILTAILADANDHIVEIGAGQGALTTHLANTVKRLDLIEIDRDLVKVLQQKYAHLNTVHIHQQDVLEFDFNQLMRGEKRGKKMRVVGNLPYNISTPLLFHLTSYQSVIKDMLLMLQKEVSERITAEVGSSNYSRLSVMMQYYWKTKLLFEVPSASFQPPPKVDSAVICLSPLTISDPALIDRNSFEHIVRLSFNQRRKMISNSLANIINNDTLTQLEINPKARPQNLSVRQFIELANSYHNQA